MTAVRVLAMGEAALLVELDQTSTVLALHAALASAPDRPAGVLELVPAARTLLIGVDPRRTDLAAARSWLEVVRAGPWQQDEPGRSAAAVTLGVRYDGPDLDDVARLTGLGAEGVVAAHVGREWTVGFTGFAPGFGYLVGGDPRLAVPRLDVPRTQVPQGSVALAGGYCGVYPRPSPGGWRIIGTTDAVLWDADRDPPALLRPRVTVRFTAV